MIENYCLDMPWNELGDFHTAFLETYYVASSYDLSALGMPQRVQAACVDTCSVFLVRYSADIAALRDAWRLDELGTMAAMSVCYYTAGFAVENGIRASVAERLCDGVRQCARQFGIGRGF